MKNKFLLIAIFIMITVSSVQLTAQQNTADGANTGSNTAEPAVSSPAESNSIIGPKKFFSQKPAVESPDELLGLTPEKAFIELGAPEEIFSMRGEREWQDDVVFYYKNHIYLFWFKNRVWQFRADKRFKGNVFGLKAGMDIKEVNELLGKPFKIEEGSEIYLNPKKITRYETGFPVRLKVFYDKENSISDIYVYRGDF